MATYAGTILTVAGYLITERREDEDCGIIFDVIDLMPAISIADHEQVELFGADYFEFSDRELHYVMDSDQTDFGFGSDGYLSK